MEGKLPRKKSGLFLLITVIISLGISFIVCEAALRCRHAMISSDNHLGEGLFFYDEKIGWKLSKDHTVKHRHHDFKVTYTTNSHGYRGVKSLFDGVSENRVAFVGDSFTFGLGVDDDCTFVSIMNSMTENKREFLNFGVPGYSTDQEYLLIKNQVLYYSPRAIWLVVYVGNDIYDNPLPFPIQGDNGKPFFELSEGKLILKNTPVPRLRKSADKEDYSLEPALLTGIKKNRRLIHCLADYSMLFGYLESSFLYEEDIPENNFEDIYEYHMSLFLKIVSEIKRDCDLRKIDFGLIILPGQSYFARPGSLSEQIQDFFRKQILDRCNKSDIKAIDLATILRKKYIEKSGHWFHKNEGHFTCEGNRIIAEILLDEIPETYATVLK